MKEIISISTDTLIPFVKIDEHQIRPHSKEEKLYRAGQNFLANIAASTRRKYSEAIIEFFKYAKIDDPVKVKLEDVIGYREYLVEKNLSPCTIALRISALRSLYTYLNEESLVKGNVFLKCRLPKVSKESRSSCLTKDWAKEFLTAPDRSTLIGSRDHVILSLLLFNVLRRNAICTIKKKDFVQEGRHHVLWYENKGGRPKKTKIKPKLVDSIKEYIFFLSDSGHCIKEDDYLFISFKPGCFGNKLTDQAVYYIVKKYAERIGCNTHPHVFRHSGITMALAAGAKLEAVQNMAGHDSIQSTIRYNRNKDYLEDHGTDYIEVD